MGVKLGLSEHVAVFAARIERGDTLQAIADDYQCSRQAIYQALRKAGLNPRRPTHRRSPQQKEQDRAIVRLAKAGHTMKQIALRTGHSWETIDRVLRHANVPRSRFVRGATDDMNDADREDVLRLHRKGVSAPTIASRMGISVQRVRRYIRRENYRRRRDQE